MSYLAVGRQWNTWYPCSTLWYKVSH